MKEWIGRWMGACAFGIALTAQAAGPEIADWAKAQPVASLSVRPIAANEAAARGDGRDDLYFVEGAIVDLNSGATLMKPRLVVRSGQEASIESGVGERVTLKLTVRIDAGADRANALTELWVDGIVTGKSTTRFSFVRI